jgi:hypothetical protein
MRLMRIVRWLYLVLVLQLSIGFATAQQDVPKPEQQVQREQRDLPKNESKGSDRATDHPDQSKAIGKGAIELTPSLVVSIFAFFVSLFTLFWNRRMGHEVTTQRLIHDQYELCRVLDVLRVDHPEVSHVLALPMESGDKPWKNYELFKSYVRQLISGNGPVKEADRVRVYLQEHATALHVYDIYEQTLFQRDLAKRAGDKSRFEVLDTLAHYYESRTLRNPRLRFHWEKGASDMMEKSTQKRYDEKVKQPYPDDVADDKSPLDD